MAVILTIRCMVADDQAGAAQPLDRQLLKRLPSFAIKRPKPAPEETLK